MEDAFAILDEMGTVRNPFRDITTSPGGFPYLMDDLSTSPASLPHRPPARPWTTFPGSSFTEHIVHEILHIPSERKTTERLRIGRRSPVAWFFWSKHYVLGLGLLKEGRDPDFVDIPESHFPALFSMDDSIHRHIDELERGTNELEKRHIDVFKAFLALISDLFSDARLEQSRMRKSGQVSFGFLWTLFPRGQIVYERRPLPFCDESYEQCLRVASIEKARSPVDGMPTWHLILQDVVFRHGCGPCLVTTRRDIRSFSGTRSLTDECIGLIPLDMIRNEERTALIVRMSHIGRRYVSICSQPWTIWEYEGPALLGPQNTTRRSREAFLTPPDKRPWQRYTQERVVVDFLNSQAFYRNTLGISGWIDEFSGHESSQSEPLALDMDGDLEHAQRRAIRTEGLYLICRNHAPAFLLDSSVEATGILISLLRAPVWGDTRKAAALPHHTMFMSPENAPQLKRDSRPVRYPGLVMLFEGPRRMTREITSSIAEDLQKPLVMIQPPDSHKDMDVVLCNVLRWGGILLVEGSTAFSGTTYEQLTTHPGVVFLASDKPEEVPETCFTAIDAVVNCNTMIDDSWGDEHVSCGLWYQCLADKLPELVEATPVDRLRKIAEVLASVEPRETRMAKPLLTAKRLAHLSGEAAGEGHIFQVLRRSIAPKDTGKFDSRLQKIEQWRAVTGGQEGHMSGL
ncbi:hypothetical protein K456DRAFT_1693480 [Colletotrichum gloeosporioides 23]|nr:hypothetical protein K456DRAFT_1693480 [Colletotrichum gloeosporioides 23]